ANIAIVGTYLDQVPDSKDHEEIEDSLETEVLGRRGVESLEIPNDKAHLCFFPIDNTNRDYKDNCILSLRESLSEAVADKDFVKKKVPLRWSYCLGKLLAQDKDYLLLDDVERLSTTECHILKEDVSKMLKYMHELGVLVHLTTGQHDVLRHIVVIRPQWLLENLSRGPRALAYVSFKILPKGVFQRFITSLIQSLPDLVGVRNGIVFSNFASLAFDNVDVILETSGRRIMLYFETLANKSLKSHVKILQHCLESIDSSFMRKNLGPKLFLSSDGSDSKESCASIDAFMDATKREVSSLQRGKRLPLERFSPFVENGEAARGLHSSVTSDAKPFDVFLSHDWGEDKEVHRKVKAIAGALETHGIRCWLDEKHIGTEILESMADGIDRSKAFVVFVTREYMRKVNKGRMELDNCRDEFCYALQRLKPASMIPCVLEGGMEDTSTWEGRFGISWSGNPLYVHMLKGGKPEEVKALVCLCILLLLITRDDVPDSKEHKEINSTLKRKLLRQRGVKSVVLMNHKERLCFFPIDNTGRDDKRNRVMSLRESLSKAVADKDFVKKKVPLRWSYCLEKLLAQDKDYLSLRVVKELATKECHVPEVDVPEMLKYMHELGVLVHLATGQHDVLRHIVVIRPQWLLENLSRVICDPIHMERHEENLLHQEKLPEELRDALDDWLERGVASRELLEWLWLGQPVDYLIELMHAMLLACPSPWIDEIDEEGDIVDKEGALLIPSLLQPVKDDVRTKALCGLGEQHALAYIEFKVLPKGVFQRFVASLIQSLPGLVGVRNDVVFSNFASIAFDNVSVILETSGRRIMLHFETPADKSLKSRVEILQKCLKSIDSSFMRKNLGPKLFLSSDGSDSKESCASIDAFMDATKREVSSLQRGKRLPLERFSPFVENGEAARGLHSSVTSDAKPFDVFLSHAWGENKVVHNKVKAVAAALEKRGIRCWLDENDIGTEILDSMADGIDRSKAFVVFVGSSRDVGYELKSIEQIK
ncbi:Hypothetical Protein FCC1311_113322, partial [Hondaea fermentalgiana]